MLKEAQPINGLCFIEEVEGRKHICKSVGSSIKQCLKIDLT